MPKFKTTDNSGNIPQQYQAWSDASKFQSKDRVVTHKGKQYVLIEKKEKKYSTGERIGRAILGALALVGTAFIGLASKNIRELFTAKVQTQRFAQPLMPNTPAREGQLTPPQSEVIIYWNNSNNHFKIEQDYNGNHYLLTTSRWLVQNNPEKTLEKFYSNCFLPNKQQRSMKIDLLEDDLAKYNNTGQYKRSPVIDQGGVTREIITVLFSSINQKALNREGMLQFQGKGGSLPVAKNGILTDDEAHLYQALGKLMAMCFTSGQAVIGNIFHPKLYEVLEIILSQNLQETDDTLLFLYNMLKGDEDNELLSHYNEQDYSDDKVQKMFNYFSFDFATNGEPEDLPDDLKGGNPAPDAIRANMQYIKDQLKLLVLDDARSHITPILQIAQGMKAHSPNEYWGNANDIMINVQGKFTKDDLKAAIQGSDKLKTWVSRWIDEIPDEKCQDFIRLVTGSNTLGQNQKIHVSESLNGKNRLAKIHTCSGQIDFGSADDYDSYEIFKEKLEESLLNGLAEGFGVI